MAKGGRKYPLVIYTRMIDLWWPAVFTLGLALLGLGWALYSWGFEQWRWLTIASLGVLNVFLGLLFLITRTGAYVQPFSDYLKLATPFLRLNISYKRFVRASSANFGALFPPQSVSKWQAELVQPLAKMTALVIELNGHPMPRSFLKLFLSPLFFKDTTPHFVILVNDWMRLSSEMESMRTGAGSVRAQPKRNSSILSKLPTNKK
jgi:hypothetical protein